MNEEVKYQINKTTSDEENLVPPNKDFAIVIPKIRAVAPIITIKMYSYPL